MRRIMLELGTIAGMVTFRQNTGQAWVGDVEKGRGGAVIIHNPRPLQAGLVKGSSDLIGWRSLEVTPAMVGKRVAVFVAVEVKSRTGRATPEQINFINQVNAAGGIAGIARSEAEALALVNKFST